MSKKVKQEKVDNNKYVISIDAPAGKFHYTYEYWLDCLEQGHINFFDVIDEDIYTDNNESIIFTDAHWYAALAVIMEAKIELEIRKKSLEYKSSCLNTYFDDLIDSYHFAFKSIQNHLSVHKFNY